jgi:hypothetical protein
VFPIDIMEPCHASQCVMVGLRAPPLFLVLHNDVLVLSILHYVPPLVLRFALCLLLSIHPMLKLWLLLKIYGLGGIDFLCTISITCNVQIVVSISFYSSSIVPMRCGGSKIVIHNVHEIVPSKLIEFHCFDGPNFLPFE